MQNEQTSTLEFLEIEFHLKWSTFTSRDKIQHYFGSRPTGNTFLCILTRKRHCHGQFWNTQKHLFSLYWSRSLRFFTKWIFLCIQSNTLDEGKLWFATVLCSAGLSENVAAIVLLALGPLSFNTKFSSLNSWLEVSGEFSSATARTANLLFWLWARYETESLNRKWTR